MPNLKQLDALQPLGPSAPGPQTIQLVCGVCRMLAGAFDIERVDITLAPDHDSAAHMPLIRQSKELAHSWDLDAYIRLQAGVLRLTFIKRKRTDDTRRALLLQNGKHVDQAG